MPFNSYAFGQIGNLGGTETVADRSPFAKYQFLAEFELQDREDTSSQFTLKTFELPRWTVDSQVINQYNHKSVIQTKMNFEPITISFYDQQNDAIEAFISDVVKGQFDATDGSKNLKHTPMNLKVHMHKTSGGAIRAGLDVPVEDADLIASKTYELHNAYIVDAQHDTLDYATSDVVLWTLTLRYEFMSWYATDDANFSNHDIDEDANFIRQFPENKAPSAVNVPKKKPDTPAKKEVSSVTVETKTIYSRKKLTGQESQAIVAAKKAKIKTSQAVNKKDSAPNEPIDGILLERLDNFNGQQILKAVSKNSKLSLNPAEAADVARIVRMQDDKLGAGVLEAKRNQLSPAAQKALTQVNRGNNRNLRKNIQTNDNILRTKASEARKGIL